MSSTSGSGTPGIPPGWHPDPWGQAPLRWWDGREWTAHLSGSMEMQPWFGGPPPVDPRKQVTLAESTATWLTRVVFLIPLVVFGTILGFGLTFGRLFDLTGQLDTSSGADADAQFDQLFDDFGSVMTGFVTVQLVNLLFILVLVMRVIWTYRIVNAARALGRGGTREPGLACAAWIIPIVNFWWPYQTMRDVFPTDERPMNRLVTWWVTYLVSMAALGGTVFTIFLPTSALVAVALVAAVPSAISAFLERRLIMEATALVRRDAEQA